MVGLHMTKILSFWQLDYLQKYNCQGRNCHHNKGIAIFFVVLHFSYSYCVASLCFPCWSPQIVLNRQGKQVNKWLWVVSIFKNPSPLYNVQRCIVCITLLPFQAICFQFKSINLLQKFLGIKIIAKSIMYYIII